MILAAGPYRSGVNDDPGLIRKHVAYMNKIELQIYQIGYKRGKVLVVTSKKLDQTQGSERQDPVNTIGMECSSVDLRS